MELVPLPKGEWGHFYAENVYMVDLDASPKKRTMIQLFGNRANYVEMNKYGEYFDKLTNYVSDETMTRKRIAKGKEDEALLRLFENSVVWHHGSHRNLETHLKETLEGKHMFCVYAPYNGQAKAYETEGVGARYLNSSNAYLVITDSLSFLWHGKGANKQERDFGKECEAHNSRQETIVDLWNRKNCERARGGR